MPKTENTEAQLADQFDISVSFPLKERDYSTKTRDEINQEQREKDRVCLEMIAQAALNEQTGEEYRLEELTDDLVAAGKIDHEYAENLRFYLNDGMATYRDVFFSITDLLGIQKSIKIIEPSSGRVIVDDAHLGQITPNNCTILEYVDRIEYEQAVKAKKPRQRDFGDMPETLNPVYLTMPGLKSIGRSLQKYEKYYSDYRKKVADARKRYGDTPQFIETVCRLRRPGEALSDIARCSISVKRLQNIRMWADYFMQSPDVSIDKNKTKDKFCQNDVRNANSFTENNFRNYVFYLELPSGVKVEVQLKITALDEVDKLTHPLYEKLRDLKRLIKSERDKKKRLKMQMDIHRLEYSIKAVYRMGIEKHNQNEVFDKVYRVEEQNRIMGRRRLNNEGLDVDALEIIDNNFLARPKQAYMEEMPVFDVPMSIKRQYVTWRNNHEDETVSAEMKSIFAIYDNSPYLQKLFRDCPPHIRQTIGRYEKYIKGRYLGQVDEHKRTELLQNDLIFEARSDEECERLISFDKEKMELKPLKIRKNKAKVNPRRVSSR